MTICITEENRTIIWKMQKFCEFGLGIYKITIGVLSARLGYATQQFWSHTTYSGKWVIWTNFNAVSLQQTYLPIYFDYFATSWNFRVRTDLKHKTKFLHFTVEKPRRSQEVKTCAQGHTANQKLCQEQKQNCQTLKLGTVPPHLIAPPSQRLQRGRGCSASSKEVILSFKISCG